MLNSARPLNLGIVIVNWNSGGRLSRLLESVEESAGPVHQIIVVDNHSTDFSLRAARDDPQVVTIEADSNLGFGGGANLGIRRCQADYVLLLNPDITLLPGSVPQLLVEIESRPRAAIVCGELVDPNGRSQFDFQIRPLPTFWSVLSDVLFLDEVLKPLLPPRTRPTEAGPVEQPAAACWLLRKVAWSSIGGFDEGFWPAWFEDVDFCRRLREKGWEMVFVPGIRIVHEGGASLQRLGYDRFLDFYYANLLRYWRKHHPESAPFLRPAVWCGVRMRKRWARR